MLEDDALKAYSREAFVGNECDTDEYRETQPEKGLAFIHSYVERIMHTGYEGDLALERILGLTADWLKAYAHDIHDTAYAGAEQLTPIMAIIHDDAWARGTHPYGDDYLETVKEDYKEDVK